MRKIVVTGPESTGKSRLCEELSILSGCPWIPELSREVVGSLGRPYQYEDLEFIAREQIRQTRHPEDFGIPESPWLIFDTWLIITKVWFQEVYQKVPAWLDEAIAQSDIDLFLVCLPDIPWEFDPLRENPHRRDYLMQRYIQEISNFGFPYRLVGGLGEQRTQAALNAWKDFGGLV